MRSLLRLVSLLAAAAAGASAPGPSPAVTRIEIPNGAPGVGYDDLQYAPGLKRILVPSGRTGTVTLIDPATAAVTPIAGFTASPSYQGGHREGTTSAAELDGSRGLVVATDREARMVRLIDVGAGKIVASAKLAATPDYVRVAPAAREVWVTEPGAKQIEVLRFEPGSSTPRLARAAAIAVPGGPESLAIDATRGRAYTHTWTDTTYGIDLATRRVVAHWPNGCHGSRGIALDEKRGFVFTGCAEGRVTVVDATTRKLVASAAAGDDVDSIGYGATLGHLYVPGAGSRDLTILAVSARGALTVLGRIATAADAHTAAFDPGTSTVYVGTPEHGVVLAIHDPYPAARD